MTLPSEEFLFYIIFVPCLLAHLSPNDKVSFCDHILSVVHLCSSVSVRASIRKQFLKTISPPKPLIGF